MKAHPDEGCTECGGKTVEEPGRGWWCLDKRCTLSKGKRDIRKGDSYFPDEKPRGKVDPNDVMSQMCATCPFRDGSPYAELAPYLTGRALSAENRICHSTGNNPAIKRVKVRSRICRGARQVQLNYFHAIGVIPEPTDKAWAETLQALTEKKTKRTNRK